MVGEEEKAKRDRLFWKNGGLSAAIVGSCAEEEDHWLGVCEVKPYGPPLHYLMDLGALANVLSPKAVNDLRLTKEGSNRGMETQKDRGPGI